MLCHKIVNMRAGGAVLLVPDSGTKFPPSDTSTKPYFQAQLKSALVELFSTKWALELQEWAKFRRFSQDELPSSMSQAKVLAALPDAKQSVGFAR